MQSNYLPPLEPIGDFRSYVCGDVVINETAAIASGVLIQADQGGKIIIAAGVCIGMGAVLHAQDGILEICAGANLGAGVLVYGSSKIGEGACIGASSSIVRAVIAKGAIVPPCSLISGLEQGAIEKEISPAIAQDLEINKNIAGRSTTEAQIHVNVAATTEIFVANAVERKVTEVQVEIPTNSISEISLESHDNQVIANNALSTQTASAINPLDPNISTLANTANSAHAKAYAQSQINRYIKRLYPQT